MAKYDAIHGAGNVTVQAPPDFWTAAKQSFDDDYDRLVAAQERKSIKEQQDIDNNRAERQLNMQEEQAAMQKEAVDRQKFMTELSMFTDPSQKAMWAKRTGVSKGWVSREQVGEWEEQGIANQSYESLRKSFISGDANTRSLVHGKLRERALEANIPASEIKLWDEWGAEADEKVGMKQALNLAFTGMPKSVQESMRSIIDTDYINESTVKIIENKLKESAEYSSDVRKGKVDLLKSLRSNIAEMDEMTPESVLHRFQSLELQLSADIAGAVEEDIETRDINLSLEDFDPYLTGKDKSYDVNVDEDRKRKIFNNVTKSYQKEWDAADESGRRVIGQKIIDEINKTSYDSAPKIATFGGGEIQTPEYEGVESLTEKVINDKIQEVYKRKGFTTKDKLKMMTAKVKTESRKQAINELLSQKRMESKSKSKKIAREINKEMAERMRKEELLYGADWNI